MSKIKANALGELQLWQPDCLAATIVDLKNPVVGGISADQCFAAGTRGECTISVTRSTQGARSLKSASIRALQVDSL